MANRALWYRHWLELRGGFGAALVLTALLGLLYPLSVFGPSGWFRESDRLAKEVRAYESSLPAMGADQFFPWAGHVWVTTLAALVIGIFLAGTGIRHRWMPGHASRYYTLTLPVSRASLIATRYAAACATGFAALA